MQERLPPRLQEAEQQFRHTCLELTAPIAVPDLRNDFRPDYKKLGILKQQFPDTPILALTATATQQVLCREVAPLRFIASWACPLLPTAAVSHSSTWAGTPSIWTAA